MIPWQFIQILAKRVTITGALKYDRILDVLRSIFWGCMLLCMYLFCCQQRYNKIRYQYKKVSCMKKEENEFNCFQGLFRTQIKLFAQTGYLKFVSWEHVRKKPDSLHS